MTRVIALLRRKNPMLDDHQWRLDRRATLDEDVWNKMEMALGIEVQDELRMLLKYLDPERLGEAMAVFQAGASVKSKKVEAEPAGVLDDEPETDESISQGGSHALEVSRIRGTGTPTRR